MIYTGFFPNNNSTNGIGLKFSWITPPKTKNRECNTTDYISVAKASHSDNLIKDLYNKSMSTTTSNESASLENEINWQTPWLDSIYEVQDFAGINQREQLFMIIGSLIPHNNKELDDLFRRHPLYAFKCEDDSIRIEWHFINLIVVWDIEENIKESCWTITSTKEAGNYSKGFYFTDLKSIKYIGEETISMINNQKEIIEKIYA